MYNPRARFELKHNGMGHYTRHDTDNNQWFITRSGNGWLAYPRQGSGIVKQYRTKTLTEASELVASHKAPPVMSCDPDSLTSV